MAKCDTPSYNLDSERKGGNDWIDKSTKYKNKQFSKNSLFPVYVMKQLS